MRVHVIAITSARFEPAADEEVAAVRLEVLT
jgi:urease beta subunit